MTQPISGLISSSVLSIDPSFPPAYEKQEFDQLHTLASAAVQLLGSTDQGSLIGKEVAPLTVTEKIPDSASTTPEQATEKRVVRKRVNRGAAALGSPSRKREKKCASTVRGAASEEQIIHGLMQKIPFDFLKASLPLSLQASVEQQVKSSLPALFWGVRHGASSSRVKVPLPSSQELTIRCGIVPNSTEYEVYVRYLANEGTVKQVYKQIFLSGSEAGHAYAYGKIRHNAAYTMNVSEMVNELSFARLFQSSPYIVHMEPVQKRKNASLIKGAKMPWYEGSDLYSYNMRSFLGSFYREKLHLAADIARGLAELHAQNLCHMDLKPANIVLSHDGQQLRAKICDLGRISVKNTVYEMPITSRPYTAPELIDTRKPVDPSMDIWGFGIILLELMHGSSANLYLNAVRTNCPESAFQQPVLYPLIRSSWIMIHNRLVHDLSQSPCLIDHLIIRMLDLKPENRPLAAQVVQELEAMIVAGSIKPTA